MKKIYEAKHHVPIAGRMKAPGDCFMAELSEKSEAWLVETGAIEIIREPDETMNDDFEQPEIPDGRDEPSADMPADEPVEEEDEAGEAPEIDPTEGIIGNENKAAAKKRGGKKQ